MANNYKDALERAKQAIIDCGSNASRKEMIYSIFPELRESEDERIKDTLHSIICRAINDQGTPYEERVFISKKVLPYVEKLQGQKSAEWSEEDEHYFQNLIMAVDSTFSEGYTKDWLQNRFKSLRPQPKQEWSDEDRHAIENCEYAIKETFKDEQNPHRIGTLDWLKSLSERFK